MAKQKTITLSQTEYDELSRKKELANALLAILEGDKELRTGKTISAGSIDEALKVYERTQKKTR